MHPGSGARAALRSAIISGIVTAAVFVPAIAAAQSTPTLSVTPTSVPPGGTVTVTVANGPGNATDWVGLFTTAAADTLMLDWKYLNGQKTAPATGVTTATVTFTLPLSAGTYNVRFFPNNANISTVTSATITVQQGAMTMTVTPLSVSPGGTITVSIANGPGSAGDYVGLFTTTALDAVPLDWKYLNGTRTQPIVGLMSATVTFTMPATAGAYNVRFFANNSLTRLAVSSTITVQTSTATPTITVTPTAVAPSGSVTVSVANGPGNLMDWIALYPQGAADSAYIDWRFLNGLKTVPASGLTSATVTFPMPAAAGTYTFKFFANNAFTLLAVSGPVTVGSADVTPPSVSITAPTAGATVSGTVTIAATASDNVGVAGVQFKLDGATLGAEDVAAPYSLSWNTTGAANGSHSLTAVARDAAGNTTTSSAVAVTVSNDTTPPVISAVTSTSVSSSGATITWTTNEASDSQVDYGTTTAYGSSTALNASAVTAHSALLSGLSANTIYHYRVRSRDAAGNLALSADFTFTTQTAADTTPPTVSMTGPPANATVTGTTLSPFISLSDTGLVTISGTEQVYRLTVVRTPYATAIASGATSSRCRRRSASSRPTPR